VPLSRHRDYLSIGEVLEAIRGDFPDVSISKIRFLENEGLITPARTGSGYRKFYEPDVARLRYILALQRDEFLPLRVIRERLAQWESDGQPPASDDRDAASPPAEGDGRDERDVRLERAELLEMAGLREEMLAGLEDFSVLERKSDGYDANDLAIARAAATLFGSGVEPRHIRMFGQSADREAAMLAQVVAPLERRRDPEARAEAARAVEVMAEAARSLRWALLRAALQDHVSTT
jgi:DNA-binding transcriptional MerR regulator